MSVSWCIMGAFLDRLTCFMFGHDLAVEADFGGGYRKVACMRCGKAWAATRELCGMQAEPGYEFRLPWDDDFERLHFRDNPNPIRLWPKD